MIENKLTLFEFEKLLQPIIKLESYEKVKTNIFHILHYPDYRFKGNLYFINSNSIGVKSTYKGFEIEVKGLNDNSDGYDGPFIQFRRPKGLFDYFVKPVNSLTKDIIKICCCEITGKDFRNLNQLGLLHEGQKYDFLYQEDTLNPNWMKENKYSPLFIFIKESEDSFLVEFVFTPECYERKLNKTSLKENWLENFRMNSPSW